MIEKQGDMFTSDAPAFGHGVNTAGVMGAGVAAIVRTRFPHAHEEYRKLCNSGFPAGDVQIVEDGGKLVVNMATQVHPGPDAQLYLVMIASQIAVYELRARGVSRCAIPRIGCGIGGLRWEAVKPILEKSETDDFEWEVWTL